MVLTKHLVALAAVLSPLSCAPHRSSVPTASDIGNYRDAPVFLEKHARTYLYRQPLNDLRRGIVQVPGFNCVDLTGFDWLTGGIDDYSWWIQIQELRFLLPLIESSNAQDFALAKRWFMGWYLVDEKKEGKERAAWAEPMTAGWRSMVLVYFLESVERRTPNDTALVAALQQMIYEHQEYLAKEQNFDEDSNHGFIETLGLIETHRVIPNTTCLQLGLDRLLALVSESVSDLGVHLEHAPHYHYLFLRWLSECCDYLETIGIPTERTAELSEYRDRMLNATYFLQDHRGAIPQIGDSDSVRVEGPFLPFRTRRPPHDETVLYDDEAGYAIYKGAGRDRRYLVFSNQNKRSKFKWHKHDDVLAVYYDYDGEVILADQGKYEYAWTPERRYFVSLVAHNTIFPRRLLGVEKPEYSTLLADRVGCSEDGGGVRFTARMKVSAPYSLERTVEIPREGSVVIVRDTLRDRGEGPQAKTPPGFRGRLSKDTERPSADPHWLVVQVWNFGIDVRSITREPEVGDSSFAWLLETRAGRRFRMRVDVRGGGRVAPDGVKLVSGHEDPMIGWYSPNMHVKRAIKTLLLSIEATHTYSIETRLELITRQGPPGLRILWRGY
jgi:hypothetical protein